MSAGRRWTALLAALLLVVPLLARAHAHVGHVGPDCSVCVVSHHAPAVRPAPPALAAPVTVASPVLLPCAEAPLAAARAAHAGRGPPRLPSPPVS